MEKLRINIYSLQDLQIKWKKCTVQKTTYVRKRRYYIYILYINKIYIIYINSNSMGTSLSKIQELAIVSPGMLQFMGLQSRT